MTNAKKIQNLLMQRRFNVVELMQERDPVAKECLQAHINQLDEDVKRLTADEDTWENEITAVVPRETMRELVYGEGHAPVGSRTKTRNLKPKAELHHVNTGLQWIQVVK